MGFARKFRKFCDGPDPPKRTEKPPSGQLSHAGAERRLPGGPHFSGSSANSEPDSLAVRSFSGFGTLPNDWRTH